MISLRFLVITCVVFGLPVCGGPAFAGDNPGRADLVRLTLDAPVIIRAEIGKTSKLGTRLSPGLAPGHQRLLVRARVLNVLIAPGFIPQEIEYLADFALDSHGRPPKLKGAAVMLFLTAGRMENQFGLVAPWGQVDWSADREAYVRRIAREALEPGLKDMEIAGFGQAFNVPGSLPGESESQIFVQTESGRPVSLVVLSRPGQKPRFSVATGDIIDDAAQSVEPGSLMWYHLACGLPAELPGASLDTLDADSIAAVRRDYRFVRESLGPCDSVHAG